MAPTTRLPLFVQEESVNDALLLSEFAPIQVEPVISVLPFVALRLLFPPREPTTKLLETINVEPLSKAVLPEPLAPIVRSSVFNVEAVLSTMLLLSEFSPIQVEPLVS